MFAHVLRGTVKRIVPRENEAINEAWLADRDRYSYEGIYSSDRLLRPRIKESGEWREIDWEDALSIVADKVQAADADKIGMLASPSVTVEEAHLLSRLAAHLGTDNLDCRPGRRDFSDQENDPPYPWLGCDIAAIEQQDAILVAGSNVRREAPIIAHRLRKAALAGSKVSFVSSVEREYFFDVANYLSGDGLAALLSEVAVAAADAKDLPDSVAKLCKGVSASKAANAIAASLTDADSGLVLLGNVAGRHGAYGAVRALAACIGEMTGTKLGYLSEGANSAGAQLAGLLPHRRQGGEARSKSGLDVSGMLAASLDMVLLLNIEPDVDLIAHDDATDRLAEQGFVVALTPFVSESIFKAADLLLPIGTFAETSGTYVNVAGTWQSFGGIANPVGEARPAWKVLRVLGNLVNAPDFDYVTSQDVLVELRRELGDVAPDNSYKTAGKVAPPNGADEPSSEIDTPLYSVDSLVRRATALQMTAEARRAAAAGESS